MFGRQWPKNLLVAAPRTVVVLAREAGAALPPLLPPHLAQAGTVGIISTRGRLRPVVQALLEKELVIQVTILSSGFAIAIKLLALAV
jgi:hypothetical protein